MRHLFYVVCWVFLCASHDFPSHTHTLLNLVRGNITIQVRVAGNVKTTDERRTYK